MMYKKKSYDLHPKRISDISIDKTEWGWVHGERMEGENKAQPENYGIICHVSILCPLE